MISKAAARIAWIIVVVSALTLSAYSLYFVGRRYGLPWPLAAIVSACADGAAVISADLSLKYARTHGASGLAPRLATFAFGGGSAWLNAQHATILGDGPSAKFLYALPPVTALIVIELTARWEKRAAYARAGRVAESLPVLGRWVVLLYPMKSLVTMRQVAGIRLDRIREANGIETVSPGKSLVSPARTREETARIRLWGQQNGFQVSATGRLPAELVESFRRETERNGLKVLS